MTVENVTAEDVTSMIQWAEEEAPVGAEDFDRAWALLREDRPDVDPAECSLTRALVEEKYDKLSKLRG